LGAQRSACSENRSNLRRLEQIVSVVVEGVEELPQPLERGVVEQLHRLVRHRRCARPM
jgi:hypothetical protein